MKPKLLAVITGFAILFGLYHAAEYMILFKNSPVGFLAFQAMFFVAAWAIAKYQFKQGLGAWGLNNRKYFFRHLIAGMLMGIVLYGLTFTISLLTGAEKITHIPSAAAMAAPLGLFIFGNFFSSVSEDIFTRGYVFKHGYGNCGNGLLIIISASIYLLNHIYRLSNGVETCTYLFMLGVVYIIPVIVTKRLWFTGGMHWAGNCFFYATHEIIKTGDGASSISANYILVLCIIVIIPVIYYVLRKLKMRAA